MGNASGGTDSDSGFLALLKTGGWYRRGTLTIDLHSDEPLVWRGNPLFGSPGEPMPLRAPVEVVSMYPYNLVLRMLYGRLLGVTLRDASSTWDMMIPVAHVPLLASFNPQTPSGEAGSGA